ncbi:hypothetical protein [Heyndrickxia camelliae]|uniref:Uncharacterized protein n=1 Tax=Heyndrickxia camelliae TaxID=1707093 RepID=A0A2N3LCW2_9BACI|nr:hypothetical protein [Heyndrickxia camelliae]PKR82468.1 hypothetical protein CWO92_24325 [Heyndrickxia camelliae]
MKKVFKKISLLFTLALTLSILPVMSHAAENTTDISDIQDGIRIPIVKPDVANDTLKQGVTTQAATANNVGYVDVWMSYNPKRINWKVVVNPPYRGNGFVGELSVTHLSTGLNSGRYKITKMSGNLVPPIFRGKYGARLEGVLTYNSVTTGVTVYSPYLVYENK